MENQLMKIDNNNEVAATAAAAGMVAEIQSAYTIAKKYPRNEESSRVAVLAACRRFGFADCAVYNKPITSTKSIQGLSIRMAEHMASKWGNIKNYSVVLYDGLDKLIISVTSMDLECNTSFSTQITVSKLVEKKGIYKGQKVISERLNSYKKKVYTVEGNEHDILTKTNAAISKAMRNNILRLIPEDIKEEAINLCKATVRAGIKKDPGDVLNSIIDKFAGIGVQPERLELLINCPLKEANPGQIEELRTAYRLIHNNEETFQSLLDKKVEPKENKEKIDLDDIKKTEQKQTKTHEPESVKKENVAPASNNVVEDF